MLKHYLRHTWGIFMMKSVRLRRLYHPFRGLFSPQLNDDFSGTIRWFGAPAFLEPEGGSQYEASKFLADRRSVSRGHKNSMNQTVSHNFDSDVGRYRGNQVLTPKSATEVSKLLNGEEESKFLPKTLQDRISQIVTLTTADVCKVLQDQIDPSVTWQFFVWAGKQPGFKHSTETCNQMILSCCKYKDFNAAPQILEYMRQCDLPPLTKVLFSKIIQGLARNGQYQEAARIFKSVMSFGYTADTVLYNQYLDTLVKAGQYDQIDAGYAEMQEHGHVPDVYTYGILINGFRKANKMQKAWDAYTEMKAQGSPPNEITCKNLVCTLKRAGETEKALQVINETFTSQTGATSLLRILTLNAGFRNIPREAPKRDRDPAASCDERLLSLLSNTQDLDSVVRSLLDMLSQDQVPSTSVCNFVLLSVGEAGKAELAVELLRRFETGGCVLDDLSYKATARALCKASREEKALQWGKEQGHVAISEICNRLIRHLHTAGQPSRAFEFLSQLQNFEPDTATCITLTFALCKLDDPSRALQCLMEAGVTTESLSTRVQGGLSLIHKIKDLKLSTYLLFVNNLCRNRRADDAYDLLVYMRRSDVFLQLLKDSNFQVLRAYHRVLRLLESHGQVEKAWGLFLQLRDMGNPQNYIYTAMIKILGRASHFGRVYQVLKEMKSRGCVPDVPTYTAVIVYLGKEGRLNEMYRVFDKMECDGCVPTTGTYTVLSNAFVKAGQVDKAYRIFEQGIDRGCIPDVESYNAIIRGFFGANRVYEAGELFNVMLAMGCMPNAATYDILLDGLSRAGLSDMASDVLVDKEKVGLAPRPLETQRLRYRFSVPLTS